MAGEVELVRNSFREQFAQGPEPRVFRAPGRVNLIGEHTDYNLGFVLPIALDMACFAAVAPSNDGMVRVFSENVKELREWPAGDVPRLERQGHWSDYFVGVAQQIHKLGYEVLPLNVAVYSTVPVGSGLSSSASLEVASALALLHGRGISGLELALLSQRAEREFVGVPCGIMDQYVSVFGETHRAIKLDCRTVTHETAILPEEVVVTAVNTMVKHALGDSAYEARVKECAEAVSFLQQHLPGIQSLRDVTSADVENAQNLMSDTAFRRARHVTTENERVLAFTEASGQGDLQLMGRLFLASHRSLQKDYEVSCEELDFLVDTASEFTGVFGSRMTGAGFGGCTVNLVLPERAEIFATNITEAYREKFGITPQLYTCVPAAGAGEV